MDNSSAALVNSGEHTASPQGGDGSVSMVNFYAALVRCFGTIICGYLAGRFKIICNSETKGLGTFVGTFALPSLLFLSLVELNWSKVNWKFLLCMLISKSLVFIVVLVICLLVSRPSNYSRAGLMAIFCTQSNDFAIGFPILQSLYKNTHPEYASYMYLMAPISLAILNPIGLVLMEISKIIKNRDEVSRNPTLSSETEQLSKQRRCLGDRSILVLNTIKSVFCNPLLLMTLLGIVGGFVFPNGLPEIVAGLLRVFGQSFSATALFLLGLKIVGGGSGSEPKTKGTGLLLPSVLILGKVLVLPLVCHQTVNIIDAGQNFNETKELSTFGFLYGTFPAASVTFVFATQYNMDVELIARSMVLCTFISAPLMFISAKMIFLKKLKPLDFFHELDVFSFDISIAGAAACCWMLILLIVSKRFKRMPQRITTCLVLSQLMCCIGVILWSKLDHVARWPLYFQFFLFNIGNYSSRLWTALLAITLVFLQCRSLSFVLKLWPYMLVFAWGVPAVISALLIAFDSRSMLSEKLNPNVPYGNKQAVIAVFMIVMCFIVIVSCLVLLQRYKKQYERYIRHSRDLSNADLPASDLHSTISTANLLANTDCSSSDDDEMISTAVVSDNRVGSGCSSESTVTTPKTASPGVMDIEDLLNRTRQRNVEAPKDVDRIDTAPPVEAHMCSSSYNCGPNIVECNEEQSRMRLEPLEHKNDCDEHQTLQHTILLIILLCSMFVGLAVSIWTLVMEEMSGIYFELSFLDTFLNFGQGLIVLAVFIGDTGELLMPLIKFWRKIWYGANVLSLPNWSNLSPETKLICEQFCNHHLENCKKDIAKDKRWRIRVYRKVFYGSELINWLIEVGLSKDRMQAVHYARHLVDGRVLRHINNVYHFEDEQLLYNFCTQTERHLM